MESRRSVTQAQVSALVYHLRDHYNLAAFKDRSLEGRAMNRLLWQQCADVVNKVPGDPRSGKDWAKYWSELKCRTKTKVAQIKKLKEGSDITSAHRLTVIEELVVEIMNGIQAVNEAREADTKEKVPEDKPNVSPNRRTSDKIEVNSSPKSDMLIVDTSDEECEETKQSIQEEIEDKKPLDEAGFKNIKEENTTPKSPIIGARPKMAPAITVEEVNNGKQMVIKLKPEMPDSQPQNQRRVPTSRFRKSKPTRARPYSFPQDPRLMRNERRAILEQRRSLLEQLHGSVHVVWTETDRRRAEGISIQAEVANIQAKAINNLSHALHQMIQIANKYCLRCDNV